MAFFSDLWDGIKEVGSGIANIFGTIIETLVSGVFWLIDRAFDAVEAVFDLFDWLFEKIGNVFSSKTSEKELVILPPTPEVNKVYENLKNQGKITIGKTLSLSDRKAAMQCVVENGQVKKTVIAGSDKGFSTDIDQALQNGRLYKIPVKD